MPPPFPQFPSLTNFNVSNLPLHGLFPRSNVSADLRSQWQMPHDIFSVLLILGPDVIQRALAQLSGTWLTPVVFSFGWVAYSVSAVLCVFGDGRMMPTADLSVTVIGAKTGHTRANKSWALAQLVRDFEHGIESSIQKHGDDDTNPETREALRVSVFQVSSGMRIGVPIHDAIWYSGFFVMALQIAIAIVPLCLDANWAVLLITLSGTLLALLHGAMPQWRREKWVTTTTSSPPPRRGGWTTSLTQGNGSRHVMVILENDVGLDLEILSTGGSRVRASLWQRFNLLVLAGLWIVLLITVSGLNEGTWYVLAIGLIGMIHNLVVAGAPRKPSACGFHIDLIDTITDNKVVKVLRRTEERYPLVGSSLVPIFFPGGMKMTEEEYRFWGAADQRRKNTGLVQLGTVSGTAGVAGNVVKQLTKEETIVSEGK